MSKLNVTVIEIEIDLIGLNWNRLEGEERDIRD
jgi:hypothetical protein